MIVMLCVDDGYGMCFAGRRQSQDRGLRQEIAAIAGTSPLWMNARSAKLFGPADNIRVAEDFMDQAGPEDFCFLEEPPLAPWSDRIRAIYLFHWNRVYPADRKLDLLPWEEGWHCEQMREFPGSSHEKITLQIFLPPKN